MCKSLLYTRAALLLIASVLGGIASPVEARSIFSIFGGSESTADRAETQARGGNYSSAADMFLRAADEAESEELLPERQRLLLRAAECAALAERGDLAARTLDRLNPDELSEELRLRSVLVRAEIGQYETRPLTLLEDLPAPGLRTPLWVSTRVWKSRADAYFKVERVAEGVHALVQRELGLLEENAIKTNHDLIWRALSRSLPKTDARPNLEKYDSITRGWVELADIMNTYWLGPNELVRATAEWQKRYPAHPANGSILAHKTPTVTVSGTPDAKPRRPAHQRDGTLDTFALMLPLTGPLALPAAAVRDGFFAALYRQLQGRPTVLVYDTGAPGADLAQLLDQALNSGADVIVGPLAKDQVAALAAQLPPIPVLALNYLDNFQTAGRSVTPPDFFQFGLLPEEEAQQVAQRAIADGRRNALALVPEGEWGTRMLAAFRDSFQALGGTLVDFRMYKGNLKDPVAVPELLKYNAQIAKATDLALEKARRSGTPLEGEQAPAIRTDVDFVFMAAQPPQARQLMPQLRYFRAGHLPVYSTSHAYAGRADPTADSDLEGLNFCDMPWLLDSTPEQADAREGLRNLWPQSSIPLIRLYALGFDAFALVNGMQVGKLDPDERWPAATGALQPLPGGRLRRHLSWARIERGKASPLARRRTSGGATPSP